jgi:acyl-CoA dehydrogenase
VANLVGAEGDGMAFAYEWFRFERLMVAARCVGAAERLTGEMTAFASARQVGGQSISEYGLVAGMLADSLTELFAARALVYETARGIDRGADVKVSHAQCSMAKLYCSEMAGRVADRAVQVFGGRGYMRENVAERFYRELRVERIWEGTSEIQRMIIARQMTKRGPATLA